MSDHFQKNGLPDHSDPEDGKNFDGPEFQALMREAQLYGFHYTGNDYVELEALVHLVKIECGELHPVPCFGVNYEPTDRRCRICQLRQPCAIKDKRPRIEVLDPTHLESVLCESCGVGELKIELKALDSSIIRDYGCSTPGCLNTLGVQAGWNELKVKPKDEIRFAPKPEEKLQGVIDPENLPEDLIPEIYEPPKPESTTFDKHVRADDLPKKIKIKLKTVISEPKENPVKEAPVIDLPKRKRGRPKGSGKAKSLKIESPSSNIYTLKFQFNGKIYNNLTAIATEITNGRNWSGAKFFGVNTSELQPGQVLSRLWNDQPVTVTVLRVKDGK